MRKIKVTISKLQRLLAANGKFSKELALKLDGLPENPA